MIRHDRTDIHYKFKINPSKFPNFPIQCFENKVLQGVIVEEQFRDTHNLSESMYRKKHKNTIKTPDIFQKKYILTFLYIFILWEKLLKSGMIFSSQNYYQYLSSD